MREIHNIYETKGIVINGKYGQILPIDLRTILTRDKRGCTVSIECERLNVMFTVPFDEPLKDLEEAEHEGNG